MFSLMRLCPQLNITTETYISRYTINFLWHIYLIMSRSLDFLFVKNQDVNQSETYKMNKNISRLSVILKLSSLDFLELRTNISFISFFFLPIGCHVSDSTCWKLIHRRCFFSSTISFESQMLHMRSELAQQLC